MKQTMKAGSFFGKERRFSRPCLWMPLLFLGIWLLSTLLYGAPREMVLAVWLALVSIYLLLGVLPALRQKSSEKAVPLLLAAGLLMQLFFILRMPYNFSWHDLGSFGSLADQEVRGGHLGIINYLVKFGRLPMENPMLEEYKDFYHPIGYHLLQAGFFKLNLLLGIFQEAALENLQVVTLAFASGCLWLIYRMLQETGLSPHGVKLGVLFAVFQPIFFIYAGTLNNDIASVFFILLTLRCTLRWMKERTLGHIVRIGLALGCGMAVKLSVSILAIPVGLMFAIFFFKDLRDWRSYLKQFAVFLSICAPLGLGWPLFHMIKFQMPVNHVPLPAETINVAHFPLSMRFGFPDGDALRYLFYSPTLKLNYNVWFQTLKTALFDELSLFPQGSTLWFAGYGLAALFTALIAVSAVVFIRTLLRKEISLPPYTKLLFGVYGAVLLGSYLVFCIQYPYICTFNFRYILPSVFLCALALGSGFSKGSLFARLQEILTWGFGCMSLIVYGAYLLMR